MNIASAHVISLASTPHRLADFWDKFPSRWAFWKPDPFSAYDFRGSGLPDGIKFVGPLSAYGCLRSHLSIVVDAEADAMESPDKHGAVLIFEDDAELLPDASNRLLHALSQLPDDADMLYLGGQHIRHPAPFRDGLTRCIQTARTHAYIVFPRFFKRYIEEVGRWRDHIDHCFEFMAASDPSIHFYAMDPWVAFQREGMSEITNEHEPARAWDNRVPTTRRHIDEIPIVLLRCPRECFESLIKAGLAYGGGWRTANGMDSSLANGARMALLADRAREVGNWIGRTLPHAVNFPRAALTIWCPPLDEQSVNVATSGNYLKVEAQDRFEAAAAWPTLVSVAG